MIYFIGVEGGGSSCRVRIEDEKREVVGEQNINHGINPSGISEDKGWKTIIQGIDEILQANKINIKDENTPDKFYLCIGSAGMGKKEVRDKFSNFGKENYPYFQEVEIKTDIQITSYGAHGGNDGAIIIMGTGTIAFASLSGQSSKELRVGGHGFPHSDGGGRAWLGLEAVKLVFKALEDPQLASSELVKAIYKERFHNSYDELREWANSIPKPGSEEYAAMGEYVVKFAKTDSLAQQLLREAAKEVNRLFESLEAKIKQEGIADLPYYLWGGLVDTLKPYLSEQLQARVISQPKMSPVEGAVVIARQAAKQSLALEQQDIDLVARQQKSPTENKTPILAPSLAALRLG